MVRTRRTYDYVLAALKENRYNLRYDFSVKRID